MERVIFCIALLFISNYALAITDTILSFEEYLAHVKKYHPIVKQANLIIKESEARLLKARGSFDPKIEADINKKDYNDEDYYDERDFAFKIPTWYGVELKANFEQNSGIFLNPRDNVPSDGLYGIGISIPLLKGLLINKRMAQLRQAKVYKMQAKEDNQLLVNKILYDAIITYFEWLRMYQKKLVYSEFLTNSKVRLDGVVSSFLNGDKPAIDTTEAHIIYSNRKLSLEKANLDFAKASLELSNYLWINDIPVELKDGIFPDLVTVSKVGAVLGIGVEDLQSTDLSVHPRVKSLDFQIKGLKIETTLKRNNLLPQMDLEYNLLDRSIGNFSTNSFSQYKGSLTLKIPIFLRKERGDLRLAKYKLRSVEYERQNVILSLRNRIDAIKREISSYEDQIAITNNIISDYIVLVNGEQLKFEVGEGSLFLINSREAKLIENKLKAIDIINALLQSKGKLFNALGKNFS